jgi:hypothetical protein
LIKNKLGLIIGMGTDCKSALSGFYQREIEVITLGWKKPDGNFIQPLKTKYNYKFNDATKSYEKIK